jgi:hypothetical protein
LAGGSGRQTCDPSEACETLLYLTAAAIGADFGFVLEEAQDEHLEVTPARRTTKIV